MKCITPKSASPLSQIKEKYDSFKSANDKVGLFKLKVETMYLFGYITTIKVIFTKTPEYIG